LTEANFEENVFGGKDIWLVDFYAPWCGHCKKLEPEWNEAASKLKGSVKFGKVDATENGALAQKYGVKGYPTIKYWNYGSGKSASNVKDYQGARDAAGIVQYANNLL
jgi:protein disulfide-isomerase A6